MCDHLLPLCEVVAFVPGQAGSRRLDPGVIRKTAEPSSGKGSAHGRGELGTSTRDGALVAGGFSVRG